MQRVQLFRNSSLYIECETRAYQVVKVYIWQEGMVTQPQHCNCPNSLYQQQVRLCRHMSDMMIRLRSKEPVGQI